MADSMLATLVEERQSKVQFIGGLTGTAMEQKRDLSSNELELITRSQGRITELDTQINVLSKDVEMNAQAVERLQFLGRAVNSTEPGKDAVEYRSAGAYLTDYLGSLIGEGERRSRSEERLRRFHRAAAHVTTQNFAGVFPQEIVGPVINFINSSRPLVSSLGTIAVPNGPSFRRPRLVDAHMNDGVGIQAAQKDELVSQPFTMTSDTVDLSTLGGYVNVARQVLDWGVASMDVIVNQLAARYSAATERAAIAELQKSTGKVTLALDATGDVVVQAIYDAAAMLFTETGQLPTTLLAGPLGWARLGGLSDGAGRPIFPFLAPSNASGTSSADSFAANPVGLKLVVTPAITDATFWVLNGYALECYEQTIGQLSVVEPSVLGIQVAYAGYVGFYRPAPNGAIHLAP
jgi:HK97 family phage major capsid protein